jgi:putative ABC transport system ATP-binding protein
MYVIETHGLKKTYGTGEVCVYALRGIDLGVCKGEFVAIMGPSGSGKSTLLHLLGGVDVPTKGNVLLEGNDLAALDDDRRTLIRRDRLGFIFQSFNLLPAFTAEENVSLPLDLAGVPSAESRRRALETLELVGMAHRAKHIPSALSGGEQQRVAIARALVMQPALLLADEPTGNLDSTHGEQVTSLMRRLVDQQEQTIVMVTHDEEVAAQADRLVRLRDGLIEHDDPIERGRGIEEPRDFARPAVRPSLHVVMPAAGAASVLPSTAARSEGSVASISAEILGALHRDNGVAARPAEKRPIVGIGLGVALGQSAGSRPPAQRNCLFKRTP